MNSNCCSNVITAQDMEIDNSVKSVSASLDMSDIIGGFKARWNIGRMKYLIRPGLYKIGDPGKNSEVLVTSNYKLTFDTLRKNIRGLNAWILVLNTRGINVWCAAGKGSFGTDEIVRLVKKTNLSKVVRHKRLIVPQLGAPGVKAHEVKKRTGFNVVYGPVRASDINKFIENGLKAEPEMRRVSFNLKERFILTPVEFVKALIFLPLLFLVVAIIDLVLGKAGVDVMLTHFIVYSGAVITGTVLFAVLLPFLPFRSFALKGWILGMLYSLAANIILYGKLVGNPGYYFLIPVIVSFLSYNFTGSSTYTNLSGVEKELKISLPLYIISVLTGFILMSVNFFRG